MHNWPQSWKKTSADKTQNAGDEAAPIQQLLVIYMFLMNAFWVDLSYTIQSFVSCSALVSGFHPLGTVGTCTYLNEASQMEKYE